MASGEVMMDRNTWFLAMAVGLVVRTFNPSASPSDDFFLALTLFTIVGMGKLLRWQQENLLRRR